MAKFMFDASNVSYDVKKIIEHLNRHYMNCYRVGDLIFDTKCNEPRCLNMECLEVMRQNNVSTGIEWCRIARENGLDAVVDMLWGYVFPREDVDTDEMMDDKKKRYLTFERNK